MAKGVNYMVTFGDEHTIMYTDMELSCCTPENCIMFLMSITLNKKKEKEKRSVERTNKAAFIFHSL